MRTLGRFLGDAGVGLVAFATMLGCRHVPPPMALEQLNAQQMRGHGVFQARCAVCHNDRLDEGKNGPAMVGVFKKGSLPSGAAATDERVTATVRGGHGLMPAVGADMDPGDLEDLLAYLHTL